MNHPWKLENKSLLWIIIILFVLKSFSCKEKKNYGSGGIRTHASEETGALNQRLRPLGHATWILKTESYHLEKATSDPLAIPIY